MRRAKLSEMKGGWWIGEFEPSILKTGIFEVAVKEHKQYELWPPHIQKEATEYNLLISGHLQDRGQHFTSGDIWVIEPGETSMPAFFEDCVVVCVKVPSLPEDKVLV